MLKDVPIYKEMSCLAGEDGLKESRQEGLQQGREKAIEYLRLISGEGRVK